jgi:uncharacterized paraquat-inducible protein A
MNEEKEHLEKRARQAEKIIGNPQDFKVCESCDSIVTQRVATCPNCNGYRFETSVEYVTQQARLLASRRQTSVIAEDLE